MFLGCYKDVTWVFQWSDKSKVTSQELQVRSEKSRVISQELQHKSVMSRVNNFD